MKGKEFIRKIRKYGKENDLVVRVVSKLGKGGHQCLYLDDRHTTVKTGEIAEGLLGAMCKQLGIRKNDL